ncbi:hypothetical protein, partial [Campylobacter jejuni]
GAPDPYEEEKTLCDNLIQYLQRLSRTQVDESKETKKDIHSIDLNGAKLIGKNASLFDNEMNATNIHKVKKTKKKGLNKDS